MMRRRTRVDPSRVLAGGHEVAGGIAALQKRADPTPLSGGGDVGARRGFAKDLPGTCRNLPRRPSIETLHGQFGADRQPKGRGKI